jgi:hypothetical protein
VASDLAVRKRLAREKSLPPIPASLGVEALSSLGAMREQVERLSGKTGDASDRAVRLFEVERGLLSAYMPTTVDQTRDVVPGSGGTRILKAPRGLQYEHQIFGIKLTWENVETQYSAVEVWCSEESTLLDDAWRVGIATKPMAEWTMHGISMRINYTFWIRAVDWSGGVSPWCPPQGQGGLIVPAEIDTTVDEVLELLAGRVTESHLYQDLVSRIDLIDGPGTMPGSVAERLAVETAARIAALAAEASARAADIAAEASARADALLAEAAARQAAITSEASTRQGSDESLASQISLVSAALEDEEAARIAAVSSEATARADADSAEANSRNALAVQIRGNYTGSDISQVSSGLIYSERNTRATADQVLSNRIDLIVAAGSGDFSDLYAAITAEETARVNADSALATDVSGLTARLDNVKDAQGNPTDKSIESTLVDNKQAQVSGDSALSSSISALSATVSGHYSTLDAAIVAEQTARADADAALALDITALQSSVGGNAAAIVTEQTARTNADSALASDILVLQAGVSGNESAIVTEQAARASADSALAADISALQSSVGDNAAAIVTEQTARTNADSALASDISTMQTTVDGHTASIQTHASTLDGLEAEWFVKLDVNGRVSGVGLHGTGATSEFIVLSDKFMVVTPGENPQVPFVVGPLGETGANGVGIDGDLVVNGTILTRHLNAGSVTADKIGADQVSGQHIAATSDIILNEGGRLTVGMNNLVLDSVGDRMLVAPDNGTVLGQPNYSGVDYAELKDGDLRFMYWDSVQEDHVLYNSVKRVEFGLGVANNQVVTLPGVWKQPPKIIVSPADIMAYSKDYPTANQSLVCQAENIVASGLTYQFTPKAFLRLTDGVVGSPITLDVSVTNSGTYNGWTYGTTSSLQTVDNTESITVSGTIGGAFGLKDRREYGDTEEYYYVYLYEDFYVDLWLVIDGVEYYAGSWGDDAPVDSAFTKTVSGLTPGVHTYSLKIGYSHPGDVSVSPLSGDSVISNAYVHGESVSTNQTTFTELAGGTLNYMAVGE